MLDLKIVNGTIVDGTGRERYRGDVGVKDGRIVAVGQVDEPAKESVDASGRIVAPGFIDVHTHYDAQVFWDPTLSPSCYHGVTTVFGGFCGFSIAPITAAAADYIKPMLARVEGMPLEVLDAAVPWNWTSFGEYLSKFEGRVGLNTGFFAGHSPIRRVVMGERAVGEKATPEDLEQMKAMLDTALSEGAMGFSTTVSPSHNDGDGNPVPSRWADHEEIIELARIVSRHEGAGLELLPDIDRLDDLSDLLIETSIAGNRPLNWNAVAINDHPDRATRAESQLSLTDRARARGGEVIALTLPCSAEVFLNLRSGFGLDALQGLWSEIFKVPVDERIERFRDPDVRKQLAEEAANFPSESVFGPVSRIGRYTVATVHSDANRKYQGRTIADIAAEEGKQPIDVLLDIAIEDKLNSLFTPDFGAKDKSAYALRARLWADDRTLIGASDAGAHLDLIDTFAFSTAVLQHGVREHQVVGLEQAVHYMTQRPATYFGLIDRGVIAPGYHADLVVFDPETVGRGPTYNRHDLPGGAAYRLYADALGVDHVFVNGVQIVADQEHTGRLPGKVLRSGVDTRTVALDALRA